MLAKKRRRLFPEPALRKHYYGAGQSGSGKSVLKETIVYDLDRRSRKKRQISIGVLDPHGDLAQEILFFGFHTRKYWNRYIYVNPAIHKLLGMEQRYTPVINPFDIRYRNEETVDAFAQEFTNAFKEMLKRPRSSDG